MFKKYSGVYIVENLINGKAYIGQAVDMQRRLHNHFVGRRSNVILQRAIKKYGIECFSFRFLEILPNDSTILTSCEQKWIDYYMNLNMSYNICPVAESVKGRVVTEQARKNMSLAQTGKKYSQETRDKIRNAKLGKSNNVELLRNFNEQRKKPIYALNLDSGEEYIFSSKKDASKVLNCNESSILHVIRGSYKQAKRFTFQALEF